MTDAVTDLRGATAPTTVPAATPAAMPAIRHGGGPPRFFALLAGPSGVLLAGSCGRGASRSIDGGASWQALDGGPGSGAIHAFAAVAAGELLAATAESGIHRSTDGGSTWSPAGLDGTTVHAVAEAGGDWFAGTHTRGLWRSSDGGASWTAVSGLPPGATAYRVVPVGGQVAGDVIVATDGHGVWRVAHGEAEPAGLPGAVVFALVALGDGRLLAGTRGDGVHASDDGGRSWHLASDGLPDPVVHVLVADGRAHVYAGTGLGVARSGDGGRHWEPLGRAVAHHRMFSLAASDEAGLLAGSYDGVWALRPEAVDWIPIDTGLRADDALALLVDAGARVYAATSAGGRFSPDAGGTWVPVGPDVGERATYTIARVASGRLLAGTDAGLRASDDDGHEGRSWREAGLPGERVYRIVEVAPGLVLAGTLGGGLWIGDGEEPWRPADGVTHPSVFDGLRTAEGDLLVGTGVVSGGEKSGGVFRSRDGGRTWRPADCPPITVYRIVALADGRLFAGAQRSRILQSLDGGVTWRFLPDTTGLVDAKLYALAVDGRDRLYLGSGDHLLRSGDGAATWDVIGEGLDGASVFDVATLASDELLAATTWGVYRSADDGISWQPTARLAP